MAQRFLIIIRHGSGVGGSGPDGEIKTRNFLVKERTADAALKRVLLRTSPLRIVQSTVMPLGHLLAEDGDIVEMTP